MLKNILILTGMTTLLLNITSCGKVKKYEEVYQVVESQEFEGEYPLQDNGFIQILEDDNGFVYIQSSRQSLTTINPENSTFGEFPRLSGKYMPIDGVIRISKNMNYRDGNDIEEDESGSNVRGQRRTDITIGFVDEALSIRVQVYSNKINDNVNFIVVDRTIKETK